MSSIGRANIGFKKVSTSIDKNLAQGFKVLQVYHEWTSAGQTDIDLSNLNPPSGITNPNTSDLLSANIYINPQNVKVYSSANGFLIPSLSYDIVTNNIIRLKNGAQSQVNEIIYIIISPVNMTGLLAVPGNVISQTGQVAVGQTDIVVNQPFTYNNYPTQQVGDVILFLDGVQQFRNVGNSVSGEGNYYEIAPSAGNLSNTIRLNIAPVGEAKNYAIISNGVITQAPTSQGLAAIQSVASQVDAMAQDLAQATGNSSSKYQPSGPNSVDLSMFGTLVKSFISGIHYDAVVGSSTQLAAGQCTHTSVQAAINYVSSLTNSGRVLVLQGTYSENISLSSKVTIEGKGNMSFVNGSLSLGTGSSYSWVKGLRIGGNIAINSGVNSCFITECWQVTGQTITNSGAGNSLLVLTE